MSHTAQSVEDMWQLLATCLHPFCFTVLSAFWLGSC